MNAMIFYDMYITLKSPFKPKSYRQRKLQINFVVVFIPLLILLAMRLDAQLNYKPQDYTVIEFERSQLLDPFAILVLGMLGVHVLGILAIIKNFCTSKTSSQTKESDNLKRRFMISQVIVMMLILTRGVLFALKQFNFDVILENSRLSQISTRYRYSLPLIGAIVRLSEPSIWIRLSAKFGCIKTQKKTRADPLSQNSLQMYINK